jgi:hypothetical protein
MAWAIFTEAFRWSRPKSPISWAIPASPEPQQYPHDVIEAAIAAGKATAHESPPAANGRALRGRVRAQRPKD